MNLHYSTLKLDSIGKEGTSQLNQMFEDIKEDKMVGVEAVNLVGDRYSANATMDFWTKRLNLKEWIIEYSKKYPEVFIVMKIREEINDIRYLWFVNKGEILASTRSEDSYRLDHPEPEDEE